MICGRVLTAREFEKCCFDEDVSHIQIRQVLTHRKMHRRARSDYSNFVFETKANDARSSELFIEMFVRNHSIVNRPSTEKNIAFFWLLFGRIVSVRLFINNKTPKH